MITDSFRLGRFTAGRIRPILVKLKSVWDRRAVISGSDVLGFESIYISPDEPLDARRLCTMDRLEKKASTEGKEVTVAVSSLLYCTVSLYFCK